MTLVENAIDYLIEAGGVEAAFAQALHPRHLPVFIAEQYDFYTLHLGEESFLGVFLREETDPLVASVLADERETFSPAAFKKHQIHFPMREQHRGVVLIAHRLEGFVRKRLIEMKAPFIVPGVQLYWPALGLELRKRNQEKPRTGKSDIFYPATQAVVIGIMNGFFQAAFSPMELTQKLGYSLMSMTRAVGDMEIAGLGESVKKSTSRFFTPIEKRRFWEKAFPFLTNPVRDTVRLEERDMPEDAKILAGESALTRITMLGAPRTPTYAVGRDQWRRLQGKAIPRLTTEEPGTCAVQVWRYDPALFAKGGKVDVFSLYLSLKDSHDERVAMALAQAMKEYL